MERVVASNKQESLCRSPFREHTVSSHHMYCTQPPVSGLLHELVLFMLVVHSTVF